MARNDEGYGIPAQSASDRPRSPWLPHSFCKLSIGNSLPSGDFAGSLANLLQERACSLQVHRDVTKVLQLAPQMLAHSVDDLGNLRWGTARASRTGGARNPRFRQLRRSFRKLEQSHGITGAVITALGPSDPAPAERRVEEAIRDMFQWAISLNSRNRQPFAVAQDQAVRTTINVLLTTPLAGRTSTRPSGRSLQPGWHGPREAHAHRESGFVQCRPSGWFQ